jgi:hypothetical protein
MRSGEVVVDCYIDNFEPCRWRTYSGVGLQYQRPARSRSACVRYRRRRLSDSISRRVRYVPAGEVSGLGVRIGQHGTTSVSLKEEEEEDMGDDRRRMYITPRHHIAEDLYHRNCPGLEFHMLIN